MGKGTFTAEPGKQEVVITREFDAPRDLVFKVMTDPETVSKWWGPRGMTTHVAHMEPRHGGTWRFVQSDKDGNEFAFRGVYHVVQAPDITISTFEWEGMPGHVILETMTLTEKNGKTHLRTVSVYQSLADRDGMVAAGMEWGSNETMERLAELVASMT